MVALSHVVADLSSLLLATRFGKGYARHVAVDRVAAAIQLVELYLARILFSVLAVLIGQCDVNRGTDGHPIVGLGPDFPEVLTAVEALQSDRQKAAILLPVL